MRRSARKKKYAVVIGLPAKNEEAGIFQSLQSITEAVRHAGLSDYAIIVCANGCTDDTTGQVKRFIASTPGIECRLINSRPGLVNAQRRIVDFFPAETYVFPDADGMIAIDSIKLLLSALEQDSRLIVAYAKTISLSGPAKPVSIAAKMGRLYDAQSFLTPRKYFHGRMFAIKDWHVPSNTEIRRAANANRSNQALLKYCSPDILLSADDVFMSSYIMDRYGLAAIKQVSRAHCYSWPVGTFRDWFNVYRRRNIEMEKMRRWFPQYNYLWPHLNRRTDWRKWGQAKAADQLVWLLFLLMKAVFFIYLKLEFWLVRFGWFRPPQQWKSTASTKKRSSRLMLFDVDGTLIAPEVKSLANLKARIAEYSRHGDVFGLNSNRPWSEVSGLYRDLKLNGPAICEDGSYYISGRKLRLKKLAGSDRRLRGVIVRFIRRACRGLDINVVVTDDKQQLKNLRGRLILISAARRFSASIYARNKGRIDRKILRSLVTGLRSEFNRYYFKLDLEQGKIIAGNTQTDKMSAALLAAKKFRGFKLFHISDNETISRNWPSIKFCGIMKAEKSYKKRCRFIANKIGEEGLIQIIDQCL